MAAEEATPRVCSLGEGLRRADSMPDLAALRRVAGALVEMAAALVLGALRRGKLGVVRVGLGAPGESLAGFGYWNPKEAAAYLAWTWTPILINLKNLRLDGQLRE